MGTALNESTESAIEGRSTAPTKIETMRPRESETAARRFWMSVMPAMNSTTGRAATRATAARSRSNDVTG